MAALPKLPEKHPAFVQLSRLQLLPQLRAAQMGRAQIILPRRPEALRMGQAMHLHPAPELFFQMSGISKMQFLHETVLLKPGQLLLIPRGVAHRERIQGDKAAFRNLVVRPHPEYVQWHFAGDGGPAGPRVMVLERLPNPLGVRAADYFNDLCAGWGPRGLAEALARGLLQAGLAGLLASLEGGAPPPGPEDPWVSKALLLLATHWADRDLSVAGLAQDLGCSADHLSRRFHKVTGHTLIHHLNEMRLNNALELLDRSSLSVKEIATASGYKEAGYFIRLFRSTQGMTPGAYRRRPGRFNR
jgi:AraC-like DNA-binding protein